MCGRSLSLLCGAIWLASTAFALVARLSAHQARADTTPKYPKGHDARTCPLDSTRIILHPMPAGSVAVTPPAAVLHPALRLSMTQRDLTPDELSQVCRQVSSFTFQPGQYHVLDVATSTVQPGLYVVSVKANSLIRTLHIYSMAGTLTTYFVVHNNQLNHIGGQFQIPAPVRVHIVLTLWWTNAAGEIALFKLGPKNYLAHLLD